MKSRRSRRLGAPGTQGSPPRHLGRLTLLKPIARGGMGEVFLAASGGIEGAERPCVVKVIRRDHAKDQSFLARFFDEARVQAQLQHPGVAQVLEASTDPNGMPYVVVEFVEGRNLGEVRNRCSQLKLPMSWADAIAIAISICEALTHVHERTDSQGRPLDIVHRDLSPQNIMLGYAGDVKLIDFGTARGENRKCHTVNGVVFAKPGYVAPEVAKNQPGGIPADLYAVGIIMWELVAGRRFLNGDSTEHLAAVARGERNPPPIAAFMDVPLELDTIIARLTAPQIADRYQNAGDVVKDLVRVLKRAPTLANGERSVRARIAHIMGRLYPSEPARTRSEFAQLVAAVRNSSAPAPLPASPSPSDVKSKDDLFPGTRYRLIRELSSSDMGVVHEALHVDLGRKVALKVLPRTRCDNPEFESRFRSEARSLAGLRHTNLVNLHDFGVSSDGRPYYAMELLEGESLASYLERERGMDWREALRVGVDACNALEAAHEAGVVHRDIKPGNLFLTKGGGIKLIDFGIAKIGVEPSPVRDGEAVAVFGTPEYMAPEQITSSNVDARADVYALGTVLYELVTGLLPFDCTSTVELLERKLSEPVIPPSRRAPLRGIPRSVDTVLLRALAPAQEGRIDSARTLRRLLEIALDAPAKQKKQRRTLTLAASAITAATLVAIAVPRVHELRSETASIAELGEPSEIVSDAVPALLEVSPTFDLAPSSDATGDDAHLAGEANEDDVDVAESDDTDGRSDEPAVPDLSTPDSTDTTNSEPPLVVPAAAEPQGDRVDGDAPVAEPQDEMERRVANAERHFSRKQYVVSLLEYRKLAEDYPKSTLVLEGWSRAARKAKGWGESLKVAKMWAGVDESATAQLHLARVQRAVGEKNDAIATLESFLGKQPNNEDAQRLLAAYSGKQLASN